MFVQKQGIVLIALLLFQCWAKYLTPRGISIALIAHKSTYLPLYLLFTHLSFSIRGKFTWIILRNVTFTYLHIRLNKNQIHLLATGCLVNSKYHVQFGARRTVRKLRKKDGSKFQAIKPTTLVQFYFGNCLINDPPTKPNELFQEQLFRARPHRNFIKSIVSSVSWCGMQTNIVFTRI